MKLIFAIINKDDSNAVSKALTKAGYFTTKLASTGVFLAQAIQLFSFALKTKMLTMSSKLSRRKATRENSLFPQLHHTVSEPIPPFQLRFQSVAQQFL